MSDFGQRSRFKIGHLTPVKPARLRLPRGVLSISFDDFPRSAWTEAGPILGDHKVRATYFASGGLHSTNYLGLDQFTIKDLEDVAAAGHEVGSHGFDHTSVLDQTYHEFILSLSRNNEFLCDVLPGVRIDSFAYPFGTVTLAAKIAVASRFRSGRALGATANSGWADLSQLRAVGLEKRQRSIHTFDRLLEATGIGLGWLIVYAHDVSECPSEWGCTPQELDNLIASAKRHDLDILPVGEVISMGWPD